MDTYSLEHDKSSSTSLHYVKDQEKATKIGLGIIIEAR